MKRFACLLAIAALALGFGACNQHSWDEPTGDQPPTKDVFKHGHHGHEDKDHGHKEGEKHEGEEKESHP